MTLTSCVSCDDDTACWVWIVNSLVLMSWHGMLYVTQQVSGSTGANSTTASFSIRNGNNAIVVKNTRLSSASPPIGGTYSASFKGTKSNGEYFTRPLCPRLVITVQCCVQPCVSKLYCTGCLVSLNARVFKYLLHFAMLPRTVFPETVKYFSFLSFIVCSQLWY